MSAAERLNRDAFTREGREPHEVQRGLPLLVAVLTGAVGAWGATYFWYEATDGTQSLLGDNRTPALIAPPPKAEAEPGVAAAAPAVDGAAVFAARCVACHQASGMGVPGAFPPLAGSAWVTGDPRRPAAIVLRGLSGPIEVKGAKFASVMPAFGAQLKDEEIAAVLTHIRGAWGNAAPEVDPGVVTELRARLGEGPTLAGGDGVNAAAARR